MSSLYEYGAYETRYVWKNQATGVPVSPQTGHADCSALYGGDDYTMCMKISGHVHADGTIDTSHYFYDPLFSYYWEQVYRGWKDGCPQEIIDVAYVGGIWEEPPLPIPINCDEPTNSFDSVRALLLYMDTNHTGIISASERDDAWELQSMGNITHAEAQLVEDAYNAGSINALCVGAYVPPTEGKGEFVGDITFPSTKKVGENVVINCKYRNVGIGGSYFEVRAIDNTGKELGRSGFKHLAANGSNYDSVTFSMPNYNIINGKLRLIRKI